MRTHVLIVHNNPLLRTMFYLENNIIIVLQHCFKTIRRKLILNTGKTKFATRLWATL